MSAAAERLEDGDSARRKVMLLVEDDIALRVASADIFRELNFTVIEAADANEALDVLLSRCPIDIVFADVRMPGRMSGHDLARWIEALDRRLPVLLTSGALSDDEPIPEAVADRFFRKPYNHLQVQKRIHELLQALGDRNRQLFVMC